MTASEMNPKTFFYIDSKTLDQHNFDLLLQSKLKLSTSVNYFEFQAAILESSMLYDSQQSIWEKYFEKDNYDTIKSQKQAQWNYTSRKPK